MRFPGYWVIPDEDKIIVECAFFDETELDSATEWKEAWQNQDPPGDCRGYVETEKALVCAAEYVAKLEGLSVTKEELAAMNLRFGEWVPGTIRELRKLSDLLP